ncbi:MAG: hypothetical protein FWH17_04425 [Oscillospiraceae bacterium]|nr:hypothetical protein [Oscillospiraceae bacterium]
MISRKNYTKAKLNSICRDLVSEDLESYIEKSYALLLFTKNNVIKVFDENYSRSNNTLMKEYEWDNQFEYLSPKVICGYRGINDHDILITKRIPSISSVCLMLSCKTIQPNEILTIFEFIEKLELPLSNESHADLYKRYLKNIVYQIEELSKSCRDDVYLHLVKKYIESVDSDIFIFSCKNKRVRSVHGNLFSSNIFLHESQVIIIDPISDGHISSVADIIVDIATFFVDVSIFCDDTLKSCIRHALNEKYSVDERLLFKMHYILKLLVRLRFAFLERKLHNNNVANANEIIIEQVPELLCKEILV